MLSISCMWGKVLRRSPPMSSLLESQGNAILVWVQSVKLKTCVPFLASTKSGLPEDSSSRLVFLHCEVE